MVEWLLEPLQYAFMQRGFTAAVIVGIVCAVVGCYIVLRGIAFFGDALAHAVLPGLAIGYLLGNGSQTGLFWWALATAVISSLGIRLLSRSTRLSEDTAIGIVFAGMFALGIALISSIKNYAVDLAHFLFGNILGVSQGDLWLTAAMAAIVLVAVLGMYKEFQLLSFDPILAATLRLPAHALETLLFILIAATIVVSLQTVGVALVVAMLITPAAAAYLLTKRLQSMMMVAALIASVSGVVGLYLSYYLSIASGAAIVLTCTTVFSAIWAGQAILSKRPGAASA
jgi:manganese/iron transport system permease protein